MAKLLDYIPGKSFLHRANPVTKLALVAAITICAFALSSIPALLALLALILVVSVYSGISESVFRMMKGLLVVAFVSILLQTIFVRRGTPLFLFVTDEGLISGIEVGLRTMIFALPIMMMLNVTKAVDLANASVEVLHVPYKYAFTVTTALRFIPIFMNEMSDIIDAQTARGVDLDVANPIRKAQLVFPLITPLLVSSVSKADASALSAEMRGFYLRTRDSSYKRYPMTKLDYVCLGVCVVLIILGIIF